MLMFDAVMGLSDEQLGNLEKLLLRQVSMAENAKGRLKTRWAANRAMANAGIFAQSPEFISGMGGYAIPLYLPKRTRAVNNTWSSIKDRNPIVQCIDIANGGANNNNIEKALMNIMTRAKFQMYLKLAIREACDSNLANLRLRPKTVSGVVTELELDLIYPEDIIAYPAYVVDSERLKLLGWQRDEPLYEIKQKQKSGEYRDVVVAPGSVREDDARFDDKVRGDDKSVVDNEDAATTMCELLWDIDIKQEGNEPQTYVIQFARTSAKILSIEPYAAVDSPVEEDALPKAMPYEKKWIVDLRLDDDGRFYYPEYSLASRMQEVQNLYSRIFTVMEQGSEMAAMGVMLVTGGSLESEFKKITPGMIIDNLAPGIEAQVLQWNFNPGEFVQILELLQTVTDSLTGYGQLGSGENLPAGATATEVDVLAQAMQETKDEYIDCVAVAVERLWALAFQYLRIHYDDLVKAFGPEEIPCSLQEVVNAKIKFVVTGTSEASTQGKQLQKLQFVLNLAQQFPQYFKDIEIIKQILGTMDLNFSEQTVLKTDQEIAMELTMSSMGQAQAAQQQMAQGGPNGKPSSTGGGAPSQSGQGVPALPSPGSAAA